MCEKFYGLRKPTFNISYASLDAQGTFQIRRCCIAQKEFVWTKGPAMQFFTIRRHCCLTSTESLQWVGLQVANIAYTADQ